MTCETCRQTIELDELRGKTSPAGRRAARNIENDAHRFCGPSREYVLGEDYDYRDGAFRWNSNGNVIPEDCMLSMAQFTTAEIQASQRVRSAETAAFLAEYREAQKNVEPSAEELAEMRAAFGEGETVVNVLTGRVTKL